MDDKLIINPGKKSKELFKAEDFYPLPITKQKIKVKYWVFSWRKFPFIKRETIEMSCEEAQNKLDKVLNRILDKRYLAMYPPLYNKSKKLK